MARQLDPQALAHYRQRLLRRAGELRSEIRAVASRGDGESYSDIAGAVADMEDASVADLLTDLRHYDIARDMGEIRSINAALQRISSGTYGECISCGQPISRERLDAYPTAERCIACQSRFEETHATQSTPTL